jgi:antitoxin (DNA-binding transcriptional repressor) of toxin-antitoxin stability system
MEEMQAHLPEILDKLAPGDEIVIVRNNHPCARLIGTHGTREHPRVLGSMRGSVLHMADDFNGPIMDFAEYLG